jgi:hypothetical protein
VKHLAVLVGNLPGSPTAVAHHPGPGESTFPMSPEGFNFDLFVSNAT